MDRETYDLVSGRGYGFYRWSDIFTPRQLVALTTLSDLVVEAHGRIRNDALDAGLADDDSSLSSGGVGSLAYADAISVYLGLAVSRQANRSSSFCFWDTGRANVQQVFARQALPMVWDFAESNPFSTSSGSFTRQLGYLSKAILKFPITKGRSAAIQHNATKVGPTGMIISTDPPYYNNIGYADLSDYFYVWLRKSLRPIFPDLFATIVTPKTDELVAAHHRHGDKSQAEAFFLEGMNKVMACLKFQAHPAYPITIYYAFKQTEKENDTGIASTGWQTFLDGVIAAGLSVTGTWPIRTELTSALKRRTGSLASSIVLVCRPRCPDAPITTRRNFSVALAKELPATLAELQVGNIAPVDLAQAAIGPGMAVYTRYSKVMEIDGTPMSVRSALTLINQKLDEVLAEQEDELDVDTQWALAWFDQYGFSEGEFGVANVLAQAKNTGIEGLIADGIIDASRGRVRLVKPDELSESWDSRHNPLMSNWEIVHRLIHTLNSDGEIGAAEIARQMGSRAESARNLCYRLYATCERNNRFSESILYNSLVISWPEISRLARAVAESSSIQESLFRPNQS